MTYLQNYLIENPEYDVDTVIDIYCPDDFDTEAMTDEGAAKQSILKPCPFCGGEAELVKDVHCAGHGEHVETTYIHCKDCGAKGPIFSDYDDDRANMTTNAIKGWNGRA